MTVKSFRDSYFGLSPREGQWRDLVEFQQHQAREMVKVLRGMTADELNDRGFMDVANDALAAQEAQEFLEWSKEVVIPWRSTSTA